MNHFSLLGLSEKSLLQCYSKGVLNILITFLNKSIAEVLLTYCCLSSTNKFHPSWMSIINVNFNSRLLTQAFVIISEDNGSTCSNVKCRNKG